MITRRDEYVAKMKAKLDEWNTQIDELEAKARQAKAQVAQEHQERIVDLKRKRDQAQEKLKEVQEAGEDAWKTLTSGAERVWENMASTLRESKDAFFEGMHEGDQKESSDA
jgi:uncharacterized coiled-coil DUF342 family protein